MITQTATHVTQQIFVGITLNLLHLLSRMTLGNSKPKKMSDTLHYLS